MRCTDPSPRRRRLRAARAPGATRAAGLLRVAPAAPRLPSAAGLNAWAGRAGAALREEL
jgi:hypothetical protein